MYFFRSAFIALLFLGIAYSSYAQKLLRGTITDKQAAITTATVILYSLPDTTISETTFTDSVGSFSVPMNIQQGLLGILAPGYKTRYKIVNNGMEELMSISMDADTEQHILDHVIVSVRKPLIVRKVDKTVFNVENSVSSIGSDAFELLKRSPGVRVNNGEISIVGKGSVSIMLNDKLVQISGEELEGYLHSISSENIARIEVITTPPAKYDAEGNSGIINIISKHSVKSGLNGNIGATYIQRVRPSEMLNGAFNYRNDKWNIYGNGLLRKNVFSSVQDNITYYPTERQEQRLIQVNHSNYYGFELGVDYNLSKSAVIGASVSHGSRDKNIDQDYTINALAVSNERIDSIMRTAALQKMDGGNTTVNANYEWRIDTSGKKLNIDYNYFHDDNNLGRNFTTNNFLSDGTSTGNITDNRTYGGQNLSIQSVKTDISWPTNRADLSFGAKASFIYNNSDNKFTYLSNGNYITDILKTDAFEYWENTQAIYFSGQKHWDKWESQVGLRGEYTQTKGISASTGQANTNSYFRVFPTAYLEYKLNEDNVFNINYSRRIERPDYSLLNPFRQYTTATSYNTGNPFLQPYAIDNLELGYTLRSSYTFTLFAKQDKNFFTGVSVVDTQTQSYYFTNTNAASSRDYGVSASATINLLKWWEATIEVSGFDSRLRSTYYGDTRIISTFGADAEINNSFTLNKKKTMIAELGYRYQTDQQEDLEIQYGFGIPWGGFKAVLLQKRLTIAMNFNDPFKKGNYRLRNIYNNTYQNHYYDQQSISLSVNWKFGNKNIKDRRERTATEEMRRAGAQ